MKQQMTSDKHQAAYDYVKSLLDTTEEKSLRYLDLTAAFVAGADWKAADLEICPHNIPSFKYCERCDHDAH